MHETINTLYSRSNIRSDLAKAHAFVWRRLGAPGSRLTGRQKVDVVAETRSASNCVFCAERKKSPSPKWIVGNHANATDLPENWVDAIHMISTDAGRMTRSTVDKLVHEGFDEPTYVEILGTSLFALSIDAFHYALGLPLLPLPEEISGAPTGDVADDVDDLGAWVPVLSKRSPLVKELWPNALRLSNVARGLSLVPAQVRDQVTLIEAQYLPLSELTSLGKLENRAISRAQMELIAGRVSSINNCFY